MYIRGYYSVGSDEVESTSNGTSALVASFGYTRHVELGVTQILYQDLNYSDKGGAEITAMIPSDTYVRFKFGGYQINDNLLFGVMPVLRYRVGQYHDIQFEPYESAGIEIELLAIGSYYQKPLTPERGLAVHFNLGGIYHNDGSAKDEADAQSITFLISVMNPREKKFDYGAELYGSFFISRPNKRVLGREDWMYFTPMIQYKISTIFKFILGLDMLVLGKDDTSVPYNATIGDFANYSTWRLSGKVNYTPSTFFRIASDDDESVRPGRAVQSSAAGPSSTARSAYIDRQAMFKWAIEERDGQIEAVDLDLEKIRQERKRAEEELERLKKQLEKKKQKKSK